MGVVDDCRAVLAGPETHLLDLVAGGRILHRRRWHLVELEGLDLLVADVQVGQAAPGLPGHLAILARGSDPAEE